MSGDEPYMLASNLPDVAVLVDKDRVKSGRYAIDKLRCDTLILDDGFQYLALKHRVEIVLVDCTNPFSNEQRAAARSAARAHPQHPAGRFHFHHEIQRPELGRAQGAAAPLNPARGNFRVRAPARTHVRTCSRRERQRLEFLRDRPVAVVSGIAIPEGFEGEIRRRRGACVYRKRYADHHRYTQQEIIDLINRSKKQGASADHHHGKGCRAVPAHRAAGRAGLLPAGRNRDAQRGGGFRRLYLPDLFPVTALWAHVFQSKAAPAGCCLSG